MSISDTGALLSYLLPCEPACLAGVLTGFRQGNWHSDRRHLQEHIHIQIHIYVLYHLSLPCSIGNVNYSSQFIYYNRTYNIWTYTQYNIINDNTKFGGQLEFVSVTTSKYMCTYINISKN